MNILTNDTIAAISTAVGEAGIGVVRMSGDGALTVADRIFTSSKREAPSAFRSHTVHFGHIKAPGGEALDEVLLTVMRSPRTYTAEDVVEISCHGGRTSMKRVLELCLRQGARLAEPGEFTKRAFLNSRIDLAQAEAVLDVIQARTDTAQKVAVRQLRGEFSEAVGAIRSSLVDILSSIELGIDFSQEDVSFPSHENITAKVSGAYEAVKGLLETSEKGIILREGADVVIAGRPNVGKSSLMNALLRHERVIVTPVAGTTRDIIEESVNIAGIKVRLSDTAGIIETRDRVELEGIKRSKERLAGADVVIFMVDSSQPLSEKDREIYGLVRGKDKVIVINKTDLERRFGTGEVEEEFPGEEEIVEASMFMRTGLERIEDALARKVFKGDINVPEGPVVTNVRHRDLLKRALDGIQRALGVTGKDYNGELLASDLNEAVHLLGLIIGESIDDDVLDRIFSQFCIGK